MIWGKEQTNAGTHQAHNKDMTDAFYCRYYVGHKGKFGHEFMEFEITPDGKLRYANNSNYRNDFMIRKEGMFCLFIVISVLQIVPSYDLIFFVVLLSSAVIEELKRIIRDSEITKEDDHNWPAPDKEGRQELEIRLDKEHISFTVSRELKQLVSFFKNS